MGWALAAAVVATGCNGSRFSTLASVDEHQGPDIACGACKVTGGGQIFVGTQRVQFDVQAIPESGPAAGPGFGGEGVAAKGHVSFLAVPASGGGLEIDASVDTIVTCTRTSGVLSATISGTVGTERFTAFVTDGGEPADDAISFADSVTIPLTAIANGNIQVHELDRCEAPCGEGLCLCPDDRETCEPCGDPPPPPPICQEGTCWSVDTQSCELCSTPPPPDPTPPLQP